MACCCCSAYLSSCHQTASDANLLDYPQTFHFNDYFVIGGIRTRLGVSDNPMFLWICSNSCPLNLMLFRSHQAEIIIVKRLIQGRNNVTRVWVEPRPFDQGRRKNDAFTHSATLSTNITVLWHTPLHATTFNPSDVSLTPRPSYEFASNLFWRKTAIVQTICTCSSSHYNPSENLVILHVSCSGPNQFVKLIANQREDKIRQVLQK